MIKLALTGLVYLLVASPALAAEPFLWCGAHCAGAKFYVGYGRSNLAKVGVTVDDTGPRPTYTVPDVRNAQNVLRLQSYTLDERRVDLETGARASSVHRLEKVKVGSLRKSETLVVDGLVADSKAKAEVRLLWGDTFTVTSRSMAAGTPVTVRVNRTMGGFGSPATDLSYYDLKARTHINTQPVSALFYSLAKLPGPGQTDQAVGTAQAGYDFVTRVGASFILESELTVIDGVNWQVATLHQLNGADSVDHEIQLAQPTIDACVRSASGRFMSGNCQ